MSQAQMAEIIGISPAGYAKIENGETESVTIKIAKRISNAIGIHFNDLFEIDLPKKESEIIEKLIAEKGNLNDYNKMLLEKIGEKEKIISLLEQVIQNFKLAALESAFSATDYYASQFLRIEDLNEEQLIEIESLFRDFSNDLTNIFFSRGCLSESDIKSYKSMDSLKKSFRYVRPPERIELKSLKKYNREKHPPSV